MSGSQIVRRTPRGMVRHGNIPINQSFGSALASLRANFLRSLLTTLGIIIGTAAVITIISITEGNTASIKSNLGQLGPNVLTVAPQGAIGFGGVRGGAGTAQALTLADVNAISSQVAHVSAVSPVQNAGGNAQVVFQNQNWNTRITGVYPGYQQIGNWKMSEGQWFDQSAEDQQSTDAVLGSYVVQQLFTPLGIDPIGQQIRVSNVTFTIVGVLQSKGTSSFGANPDDIIYVPFSTVQTRLVGGKASGFISQIQVQADSANNVNQVQADITTLLESRHGTSGSNDNFVVRNQNATLSAVQQTATTLSLLLIGVAAISLVVGGIGIMNIMLVTVTERIREIGIRVALGARRRDILTQFLIEATLLTTIGGFIGIGIGVLLGYILSQVFKWPFVVDPTSLLLSFGVSALVGIVFGFYPARRAARLDPIVALRME
jgi:putative ABC transport system permease protein